MTILEAAEQIKAKVSEKTYDLVRRILGEIEFDRDEEFETDINLNNLGIPEEEHKFVLAAVDNMFLGEYEIKNGILKNLE